MDIKSTFNKNRKIIIFWIVLFFLFFSSGEIIAATLNVGAIFQILMIVTIFFSIVAIPVTFIYSAFRKRFRPFTISVFNFVVVLGSAVIAFEFPTAKVVNMFRGEPIIVGWYEGTQNQAKLTIRDNHALDIWWTAIFSSSYSKGTYSRNKDTFKVSFHGGFPRPFNGDAEIIEIGKRKYFRFYYLSDEKRTLDFEIFDKLGKDPLGK